MVGHKKFHSYYTDEEIDKIKIKIIEKSKELYGFKFDDKNFKYAGLKQFNKYNVVDASQMFKDILDRFIIYKYKVVENERTEEGFICVEVRSGYLMVLYGTLSLGNNNITLKDPPDIIDLRDYDDS